MKALTSSSTWLCGAGSSVEASATVAPSASSSNSMSSSMTMSSSTATLPPPASPPPVSPMATCAVMRASKSVNAIGLWM